MKVISPYHEIISPLDGNAILAIIETAGRTCYKSEDKITAGSAGTFARRMVASGHHSVIEHAFLTVRFVCDRGVSHELVRHRMASFSQESTRYANYSKDKFGREITVVRPPFWHEDSNEYACWKVAMQAAEDSYLKLVDMGARAEQARSVLPNSLKTEIVTTCNLREWRHVLKLRCARAAHPQIRELMLPLLSELKEELPDIFEDMK
jgi:thymidylate synthase (FAD)